MIGSPDFEPQLNGVLSFPKKNFRLFISRPALPTDQPNKNKNKTKLYSIIIILF